MALQDRPKKFSGEDRIYEEAPVGTFAGVLVKVHDMGVQPNPYFDPNKDPGYGNEPEKHDVRLQWVINTPMSDGRPFSVSDFMSLKVTLSRKAKMRSKLTNLAEMLLGRTIWEIDREVDARSEMDIAQALIGQCAMVTVRLQKNGKARVGQVSPMPRHPDGTPMLPLPDVEIDRTDIKTLTRSEPPLTKEDRDQIVQAAATRIKGMGGGESLHRQMMDEIKARLGIESAATMPRSKLEHFLDAIRVWTPIEGAKEELGGEELPF